MGITVNAYGGMHDIECDVGDGGSYNFFSPCRVSDVLIAGPVVMGGDEFSVYDNIECGPSLSLPIVTVSGEQQRIENLQIDSSATTAAAMMLVSGNENRIRGHVPEFRYHGYEVTGDDNDIDMILTAAPTGGSAAVGINVSGDRNRLEGILRWKGGDPMTTGVSLAAASDSNTVCVKQSGTITTAIADAGTDNTFCLDSGDIDPDAVAGMQDFFNGTFTETFDALVTSAAGVITMSIEQSGGGDLTMRFSDGDTVLDTTPADTIVLTAGSDTAPQSNYVYIPQATKVLTLSTTTFPTTEHIKVAYFLVPSAAFVASDGVYINQNWNDHSAATNGQGHMSHMAERSRRDGAYYFSGLAGAGVDDYLTLVGVTSDLKIGAGVVYQMHRHSIPAFDTSAGDKALVVNWSGDAYHDVTNLFDITADSTGAAIGNNRYFNLVVWTVANKTGEYEPAMINLPSGFYVTQADAENDVDGHDNFAMPREFSLDSSTGVLVCRLTIQMKTAGPWVYKSTTDLRGSSPQTASGGAGGAVTEFADNQFKVFDETDITKIFDFQASGITTGTTRTLTVPDASGTILLEETVGLWQTWSPAYTNLTIGNGAASARYVQVGETIILDFLFKLGSTSAVGTNPIISLPVNASATYTVNRNALGHAYIRDDGTATFTGFTYLPSATQLSALVSNASTTYLSASLISATVPMTWATNDILYMRAMYEVA